MKTRIAALVALAGLSGSVFAQDSISNLGTGLPGDAPDVFSATDQVDRFVLDLAPITTSFGTTFGIGPIHKAPNVASQGGFFGTLISGQAISQDLVVGPINGDPLFFRWDQPGFGVGPNNSVPSEEIELVGSTIDYVQLSTLFNAFSTTSTVGNTTSNTLNGTIINIDPSDGDRLFVTRVLAANNQVSPGDDFFSTGVGGVDANGNAYFRTDTFFAGAGAVPGQNYYRVNLDLRNNGVFNVLSAATPTGAQATERLLSTSDSDTHSVPQALPQSIFGGNGLIGGPNFSSQYRFGGSSPLGTSTQHLFGAGAPSGVDHRGGLALTPNTFGGFNDSGVATMAILAKGGQPDTGETETINVFAVDASGAPIGASRRLFDPTNGNITDNSNGFVLNAATGASIHHFSQAAFNGGSGQVDVQVIPNGDLLGVVTLGLNQSTRFDQDPDNYIVAFREDASGNVSETLVAYATFSASKEYLDGPGGNVLGTLLPIDLAFPGATGPSVTSPAIDSSGNVWFVAPFQANDEQFADTGLFRAVYNPANFSFDLELVVRGGFGTGTTVTGLNSGTPYQVQFISIADSNSISSGAFFSSNATTAAHLGQDASQFSPIDAESNGGVILSAEIVYDVDGDGDFDDPTSSAGDPTSLDEAYNALIYVGATSSIDVVDPCPIASYAPPLDLVSQADVNAFVGFFFGMDPRADLAAPFGVISQADVNAFVDLFFSPECNQPQ